jgi:hypothetical protein
MQRYFARIIRAIIVSTLGVGGGVGLMVFIVMVVTQNYPRAFQFGVQAGLIVGLLFGLIVVAVLLPMDLSAHLFLAKGMYKEIWELEQSRDVIAQGTIKQVVAACRQALLVVPNIKNVSDDMENLITRANTGTSWRSPGEEIEVEINPVDENKWKLRCTSRSRGKNIVFDYGKNFENVETWQNQFQTIMKGGATPTA